MKNEEIKPNSLKSEHLSKEFSPIILSVGSVDQHLIDDDLIIEAYKLTQRSINVKYGELGSSLDKKGFKNDGTATYIISTIDTKAKISEGFVNCTGCIVVGVDKNTGENISFLSHQDPFHFTDDGVLNFADDFSESLLKMKDRSVEGSIDAIVVGGNIVGGNEKKGGEEYYKESIELISELVRRRLGFLPVISTQAKKSGGGDSVIFDTEKRRAYLVRSEKINNSQGSNVPYIFHKDND